MVQKSSSVLAERVATNVKAERMRLGLSQEKLASMVGVSVRYISRLENGTQNLRLDTLDKFCVALGVSAAELVRDNTCEELPPAVGEQFKTALHSLMGVYERCFGRPGVAFGV